MTNLMQMTGGIDLAQLAASKEHVLAASRDYISQPRLSKLFIYYVSFLH